MSCMTILFSKLANHQIGHQVAVTHKLGCQPGDIIWSLLIFLGGSCGYVWINILTYHPKANASQFCSNIAKQIHLCQYIPCYFNVNVNNVNVEVYSLKSP